MPVQWQGEWNCAEDERIGTEQGESQGHVAGKWVVTQCEQLAHNAIPLLRICSLYHFGQCQELKLDLNLEQTQEDPKMIEGLMDNRIVPHRLP